MISRPFLHELSHLASVGSVRIVSAHIKQGVDAVIEVVQEGHQHRDLDVPIVVIPIFDLG
jgi:F420-dependent methylenetetrahydromethanopterin dehydrogenase